jgi:hypothetical protein
MVNGKEMPLSEKPVPLQLALETVMLEELALRVPVKLWLLPTITLEKFRLAGLTVSCPELSPTPDSATETAEFIAVLAIDRLPFAVPAEGGSKLTFKVTVWPAVRESGSVKLLVLNPVPDTVIFEISMLAL